MIPRDFSSARLLRQREPYHYQRRRQHSNYPRPAQPAVQPNQKVTPSMNNDGEYWDGVYKDYLKRRSKEVRI